MRSRIQEAFDAVHAEETLKSKTVEFVSNKIAQKESRRNPSRVFAVVTCCLMVVLLGVSGAIYSAPVAAISITTGKSIELSVNSFDRVIGAESFDQDGYASSEYEDLIHMTYDAAVAALLENDEENGIFDEEKPVSISVICEEDSRSNAMQQKIIDCVGGKYGQVECYTASKEELEEAQEVGLPLGKYRAFLEWKALDPEITAEEVGRLTMREIRERIDELTNGETGEEGQETEPQTGNGRGQGHSYGYGKGGKNGKTGL